MGIEEQDPQKALVRWQALVAGDRSSSRINPATLYLANLPSQASRDTVRSVMRSLARMLGYATQANTGTQPEEQVNPESVPWQRLDRLVVLAVRELLRQDGKSTATINLYLSVMKGIAREAVRNRQMEEHQFLMIEQVTSLRGSRLPAGRALHVVEVTKLVDHCLSAEGVAGVRDAALLGMLFGCGPRRAEVVTIDIGKINFAERSVRVIGKGNKERELEMPERTIDLVTTWLDESGLSQGALFRPVSRWGAIVRDRRLTPRGVYDVVTRRVKQAGLDKASPHDLRRSFLTYLLDNEVDLSTAADLAGHASTDTTRRYLRGQKRRNRQAADKVDF